MLSRWRASILHWTPFLLMLVPGLLLTALAAWGLQRQSRIAGAEKLEQYASFAALQIESKLNEQAGVLRSLQAAFYAHPELDQRTFTEILNNQNILFRMPGFVAIAFARLVDQKNTETFSAEIRSSQRDSRAYLDYSIHPSPAQPYVQAIDYLYPINPATRPYLGFDILSLTANRSPLAISRDEGRGIASPPFPLSLSGDAPLGFMVHYPAYGGSPKPVNTAARQQAYRGSLTVIYRADQILSVLKEDIFPHVERIRIFDTGGSLDRSLRQAATLLYATPQALHQQDPAWLCSNKLIPLPGRQWQMEMCATPAQLNPNTQGWLGLIWLTGGGLSVLLASMLQLQRNAARRAENLRQEIHTPRQQHDTQSEKLAAFAEKTTDILVIRDADGQITYANPAARRHFNLDDSQAIASSAPLLLSAELGVINDILRASSSHLDELDTIRHYDAMLVPVFNATRLFQGSILHAREVTHLQEQNETLRLNNERLTDLLDIACDWQWEQDAAGHFTEVSGDFFNKQAISPTLMIGLSCKELALPGLSQEEWMRHCRIIENSQPFRDFVFTLHGGHKPLTLSLSGKPRFNADGYCVGYHGIGRDISAQHQACQQHRDALQRMLATLESLSDGVITTDLDGHVNYMNPVAEALTGREAQYALNQNIETVFQVIDPASRLPLPSLSRLILASGQVPVRHRSGVLINRFGLSVPIQEAVSGIQDNAGTRLGSVIVFRDLSDWSSQLT